MIVLMLSLGLFFGSACTGNDASEAPFVTCPTIPDGEEENAGGHEDNAGGETEEPKADEETDSDNDKPEEMNRQIELTVGGQPFTATLADNEAAAAFAALLPLELTMTELNGNEKYASLPAALPTESFRPGRIETGDLLLWGDDCVVLFYESFDSGYSYTRLGRIDNPSGLAAAVGHGSVIVSFAVAE